MLDQIIQFRLILFLNFQACNLKANIILTSFSYEKIVKRILSTF